MLIILIKTSGDPEISVVSFYWDGWDFCCGGWDSNKTGIVCRVRIGVVFVIVLCGCSVLFRRGILSESFILIVGRSEVGKKVGVDGVVQFILDEAFVTSVPFHVMLTPSVGNNGLGGWVGPTLNLTCLLVSGI